MLELCILKLIVKQNIDYGYRVLLIYVLMLIHQEYNVSIIKILYYYYYYYYYYYIANIKLPIKSQPISDNQKDDHINNKISNNATNDNKTHDKEKKLDQYEDNDQDVIKSKITGPKVSQVERFEREDHRLAGNRFGASTSMANRLHVHIKKDSNDIPYPEERESKLEIPSVVQPVTPLKVPSRNSASPDMEDIEVLNLDRVIIKKQLRLKNRRNKRNKDDDNDDTNVDGDDDDDSYSDSSDNDDGDESIKAEEKNGNRSPQSYAAPLRRARDVLNDSSMSKRTSIDDLLQIQGSSSLKEEPSSPGLDLKAEKEMRESYQNNIVAEAKSSSTTSANISKPPRPPNPKPPYAQKAKIQIDSGIASNTIDKSFLNEDWDDGSPKNKIKQNNHTQSGPGVQADANWLDEDFDD